MNIQSTQVNAFQTAYQGLQRSYGQVAEATQQIAQGSQQGGLPTRELVSLLEGEKLYQANAKTLSVSSRMLGTLLDIKA